MCVRSTCCCCSTSSDGGGIGTLGILTAVALGALAAIAPHADAILAALQRAALWASVALVSPLVGYAIGALTAHFDLVTRARAAVQSAIVRRRLRRLLKAETPALGPAQPLALPAARLDAPFIGKAPNERRNPVCRTA
jgi:hypothetical protein